MFTSHEQNAGQNHIIKAANKSLENVAIQIFGNDKINRMHALRNLKEIKLFRIFHHPVCYLTTKIKIQNYNFAFF
jgi:hypothetical protein